MTAQDKWSEWLLEKRFGGDSQAADEGMRMLHGVRDRVLGAADIRNGGTLLDVGAGDGLIAFGAVDRVGEQGRVIFADISQPLLDHARTLAEEMGVTDRCSFALASADDLSALADASVDAVTTRSVLIYVKDKAAAFREFHRVLKPGGRISLWEPINSFQVTYGRGSEWAGGDLPEIVDLATRLDSFFAGLQPDDDPMMDFNERTLLRHCELAGFTNARLDLTITVSPEKPKRWDTVTNASGNPNIPSLGEAIRRIFTQDEQARYERHARPRVEAGGRITRYAAALLSAIKDDSNEKEHSRA